MKKKIYKKVLPKKQELTYQDSDHDLQIVQNDEIRENTKLTKYALWVAILLGLADIFIESLQLLK